MYYKTPIKKKLTYLFSKIFFRLIDRIFNTTLEEIIRRKVLNLHSQNYNIIDNLYYFIHVPKTGGTTLHHFLQTNLKKNYFTLIIHIHIIFIPTILLNVIIILKNLTNI